MNQNIQGQIRLIDLITEKEALNLSAFVQMNLGKSAKHNLIMTWIDGHKDVRKRLARHGVIKAYAAYVFEYFLV